MNYTELSLEGFLNEIKDVNEGPHSRKFCFVIGAGASRSSGIKSGQELVDIWSEQLENRNKSDYQNWKEKFGINDKNKYNYYSHYYQKRYERIPKDGYNYLEKLMEHAKPSSGYVMLAHILSKTENNVVITTNFDHLIEDAVSYYIQNIPLVIGHESLSHYLTKNMKRPTIIKIHRDLLFDSANSVSDVETLHESWVKSLNIIFSEYHPIFIGYAGNDNSLMNYLIDNAKQFANNKLCCPYWMLYKSDKLDGNVEKFLDETHGYFIRHTGFDAVLYRMGAIFDYTLPTKEQFLNDAEKRYKMLSDAIDEFTHNLNSVDQNQEEPSDIKIMDAIQKVTNASIPQNIYSNVIMYYNKKDYPKACEESIKLLEIEPDNARYQNNYGVILHKMGRYDEALSATQKAIDLEPDNAEYYDSLGTTLHKMGRYDEALSATQKAIDLEPDNAEYYDNYGITLHKMGRYDEALSAKQKAIDLEPDNAEYYDSFGITLHEIGHYDEALSAKQKAIDLEPDNAEYYDSFGITLHEIGRYDEALSATQKAIDLDPNNVQYKENLNFILNSKNKNLSCINQ